MHALTLVDPQIKTYLQDIGYERWSRAYSESRRYNIMTTNIVECINGVLLSERELPITVLAERMRSLLQCWHFERQIEAGKCKNTLTPNAERHLAEQFNLSLWMRACTCTCRKFQLDQLPCPHAMVAISQVSANVYGYCSDYYLTKR
ncbi:hypothetical protein UlMin_012823 [Ulmus minor]